MEVSTQVPQATHYPALFREYIVRNTQYALGQVEAPGFGSEPDDHEMALRALQYGLDHAAAWAVIRHLLFALAPKMEQAGYRQEWSTYLKQGLERSQQLADLEAEARLCLFLGELYEYQGSDEEAARHLTFGLSLFEMLHQQEWQGRALNRLAALRWRQRAFAESTDLVRRARVLLVDSSAEQAYSHFVLGGIAFEQGERTEARFHFEESLRLWQVGGDARRVAWGMTHLGNVLWAEGHYTQAIEQYEAAAERFEDLDDPVHLALVRVNIGTIHLSQGNPARALAFYRLAEPAFHRAQDLRCLAALGTNQGKAHRQLKQWTAAEVAFQRSIYLWRQLGNAKSLVNALDGLGKTYQEQQRWGEAKVVLHEALAELGGLEADPAHERLLKMVTEYLEESSPELLDP